MPPSQHRYVNQVPDSPIASVDFAEQNGKRLAFLRLPHPSAQTDTLLEKAGLSQVIASSTKAGEELRVVQAALSPQDTLAQLAQQGVSLAAPAPKSKAFDPWIWRGITSFVGQTMTFIAGWNSVEANGRPKVDTSDKWALVGFAGLNILANITNITFGSQKKEDPHQLRLLKNQVNDIIESKNVGHIDLPDVEDRSLLLHATQEPQKTASQKAYDALQRISVTGGEIGLRTLGAISLVFPVTKWKTAFGTFRNTGSLAQTYHAAKNGNAVTVTAGIWTLAGKAVSFVSKEPDPFNPTPPSTLDLIREKITFPLSSVLEGVGATMMSHNRFTEQHTKLFGKVSRDYVGGTGNAIFIGGYGIRLFAPYGSLAPHMPELYAHTADALARIPKEQIPDRIADIAAMLETHFAALPKGKTKPPEFSELYAAIAEKLQRYHGIELKPRTRTPETPKEPVIADAAPALPTKTVGAVIAADEKLSSPELQHAMAV